MLEDVTSSIDKTHDVNLRCTFLLQLVRERKIVVEKNVNLQTSDQPSIYIFSLSRISPATMGRLRTVVGLLVVALLLPGTAAHGGSLHKGTPETSRYIRTKVASCSSWVPANGTVVFSLVSPGATTAAPVDVKVGKKGSGGI